MTKRLILLLLLFVPAAYAQMPPIEPGVSQELAQWRAARYSDVRYKLNLTLEKMSPVLKGTIEIRLKVAAPAADGSAATPIILDWRKINGFEDRSTLGKVSINGREAFVLPAQPIEHFRSKYSEVDEQNEHLIFREGVIAGENVINIDFTSPILTSGSAITRYIDKEDGSEYIYSLFVPSDASTAFPVFDQPDLKARFTLEIERPDDWISVSNTRSTPLWENMTGPKGKITEYRDAYDETEPISTYVFAFVAGPWERVSESTSARNVKPELKEVYKKWLENTVSWSMTTDELKAWKEWNKGDQAIHIYVRKSQAAKFQPHAAEVFRLNREGIKFLEQYFDYKFPFPKYDIVLIPEFPFGGMEHAGATFLRESSVIFPTEPTASDYISRANVIFHEAAHQWFGDTVTMRWFDDLWLKEGFAEFMAYKTLEKVMPEYNAWKVFYERNKQAAYLTDSTKGTTSIYQPIKNLSAAKSAYGNIVYRKAPSFLRQAEFYLGPDKFQTAVRSFLKKHEYANAGWQNLIEEFAAARYSGNSLIDAGVQLQLNRWADTWVKQPGTPQFRITIDHLTSQIGAEGFGYSLTQTSNNPSVRYWPEKLKILIITKNGPKVHDFDVLDSNFPSFLAVQDYRPPGVTKNYQPSQPGSQQLASREMPLAVFPNYQDYGYGIFLLDDKSRDYVLKNIQNEKDPFLRSMMWGALWDSAREAELDPREYVELAIKVLSSNFSWPNAKQKPAKAGTLNAETDETIIQSLLSRVSTATNYYVTDAQKAAIAPRFEAVLLDRLQNAPTAGQRVTFFRAFVSNASSAKGREVLKDMIAQTKDNGGRPLLVLRAKDKFDIVTRLIILNDPEAPKLLADLEKSETSDDAKRYAYAAKAAFGTKENKERFWNDFVSNKDISESWIESAANPFNNLRHADLTQPYLERALKELPNLKRTRKIFFINNWLAAFIGGQRDEKALAIVNKFLADNPNLDNDLRLKILENVDLIERAVKIRAKFKV